MPAEAARATGYLSADIRYPAACAGGMRARAPTEDGQPKGVPMLMEVTYGGFRDTIRSQT